MSWTQLHPNDESMMKKAHGGMISLEFDGTDYLFMVGGAGSTAPALKHPQFQYEQLKHDLVLTNELLLYNLSNGEFQFYIIFLSCLMTFCMYLFLGQFTVPFVSGQYCPPTSTFTINKINQNKGIMFGGMTAANDGLPTHNNNVKIFNVTHNTIVSYLQYILVPHVYYLISALLIFSYNNK